MTKTLEERREEMLEKLGRTEWPTLLEEVEALVEQVVVHLKTEKGYLHVTPSQSKNKPWQARTSGKQCGQRSLGCFGTPEAAARAVAKWILGIVPTPPTPDKDRSKRNEGPRKKDRCNHGKGPGPPPIPPTLFSQSYPSLAGGPDLRTSEHRPKKARRALEKAASAEENSMPMLAPDSEWERLNAMLYVSPQELQALPAPQGTGVLAALA